MVNFNPNTFNGSTTHKRRDLIIYMTPGSGNGWSNWNSESQGVTADLSRNETNLGRVICSDHISFTQIKNEVDVTPIDSDCCQRIWGWRDSSYATIVPPLLAMTWKALIWKEFVALGVFFPTGAMKVFPQNSTLNTSIAPTMIEPVLPG